MWSDEWNIIFEENQAPYHDLFRTNKYRKNGDYITDQLTSREQCFAWIADPKNKVSYKRSIFDDDEQEPKNKIEAHRLLNEFWDKYPNGLINFG